MPAKGQRRGIRPRFEEKIDRNGPNGCWVWTSASSGRYGVLWIGDGKSEVAHRVAYELYKGPIESGLFVCHTCDNGHCVNPDHLFLGTAGDNARDMIAKGRQHDQSGERNHRASLTSRQVAEIRVLRQQGLMHKDIAKRFGVQREAVGKILRVQRWR
jgi:hypothetical protein